MQTFVSRLEGHRAVVREACAERGIRIERRGAVFHLLAPGVDMITTDLSWIRIEDLAPVEGPCNLWSS